MTVQIMRTVMAALIAALAIFWAATDAAAATLVDNGTFTTDTATGLDWLDVTQTQGLSYNAVTSLFGSTLAGWQFATLAQVSKLYDDAGGAQPYDFSNSTQGAPAALLLSLLGDTDAFGFPSGWGLTADPDTSGGIGSPSAHFLSFYSFFPPTTEYLLVPFSSQFDTDGNVWIGSFLVRPSQVPEPRSLVLLGSGMLALMLAAFAGAVARKGT